jgi:hypothetical protein
MAGTSAAMTTQREQAAVSSSLVMRLLPEDHAYWSAHY